jgi:hypothetical protein
LAAVFLAVVPVLLAGAFATVFRAATADFDAAAVPEEAVFLAVARGTFLAPET